MLIILYGFNKTVVCIKGAVHSMNGQLTKTAAITVCNTVIMEQNLKGITPTPCGIHTKNNRGFAECGVGYHPKQESVPAVSTGSIQINLYNILIMDIDAKQLYRYLHVHQVLDLP